MNAPVRLGADGVSSLTSIGSKNAPLAKLLVHPPTRCSAVAGSTGPMTLVTSLSTRKGTAA